MRDPNAPASNGSISVKRGKLDSVTVYEVREDELNTIEKGRSASLQLSFAITLFVITFSCGMSLLTTKEFRFEITQSIVISIGLTCLILSVYFFLLWRKTKQSVDETIEKIRQRLNGNALLEQDADIDENKPQEH